MNESRWPFIFLSAATTMRQQQQQNRCCHSISVCCIFTAGQLPHIPPMRGTYTPCRSIQLASYLSISVRQQTLTTTMTDWMNEWSQNVMTRQQSQHSRVDIAFRYLAMQQQTPKFIWLTNPTNDRARRHRRVNGHILNTMHEKTPGYSRLLRD